MIRLLKLLKEFVVVGRLLFGIVDLWRGFISLGCLLCFVHVDLAEWIELHLDVEGLEACFKLKDKPFVIQSQFAIYLLPFVPSYLVDLPSYLVDLPSSFDFSSFEVDSSFEVEHCFVLDSFEHDEHYAELAFFADWLVAVV